MRRRRANAEKIPLLEVYDLDRAATVLRRYGLRRNGAQLGRGDWRYHTNAPYTFVITGRPRPRIATHWRPPVRTSELER